MPCVCLPVQAADAEGNPVYDKDGKPVWQKEATLMQQWTFEIRGHWFSIPTGFQTDGASIPRLLWRVCGHPLAVPRVYAALMHDWLYRNGYGCPQDIDRAEADACYRDFLIAIGWGTIKSYTEYYSLRLFGGSNWKDRK